LTPAVFGPIGRATGTRGVSGREEVIALRMPFGLHRGTEVQDVPQDYLAWLLGSGWILNARLRQEVENVLTLDRQTCLGPVWWYQRRKDGVAS
jgi:uncharacterized protein (DUF3820 family)